MNIAFFGSPAIAADILKTLHSAYPVSLVVTQPDKPVGRKQVLTKTPVKEYAEAKTIPVIADHSIQPSIVELKSHAIDLAVVVAYGMIIPQAALDIPRYGFINVHYSLLPKYRGASPVQWALLAGDTHTGVTIMQMDRELDHGPILATSPVEIGQNDTTATLLTTLTNASIPLLTDTINSLSRIKPQHQNHDDASYTRRLTKQDGFIEYKTVTKALAGSQLTISDLPVIQQDILASLNLTHNPITSAVIYNFIRALSPWPGAWTISNDKKRVKILDAAMENGNLILKRIQYEGKNPTDVSSLL